MSKNKGKKRIDFNWLWKELLRHSSVAVIASVIVAIYAFLALNLKFLSPITWAIKDFSLTDIYYRILSDSDEVQSSELTTIVDISNLYNRAEIAQLLKEIKCYNPKIVGVDIVFEGEKNDIAGDEALLQVVSNSENFVFAYKINHRISESEDYPDETHSFFSFLTSINEGFVNIKRNLYGGLKRTLTIAKYSQGILCPSFATVVANKYFGREEIELKDGDMNINFSPRTFQILQPDSISKHPEFITDKIILVGAMTEENDMHYTPLGKIPGVKLLAYAVETLVEKRQIKDIPTPLLGVITFIIVLITQIGQVSYLRRMAKCNHPFNRIFVGSAYVMGLLTFMWSAFLIYVGFLLFVLFNVNLNYGWPLSIIAFLSTARSLYEASYQTFIRYKNT